MQDSERLGGRSPYYMPDAYNARVPEIYLEMMMVIQV